MADDTIVINGGKKLEGTVKISGAKNATVALIPAAVLASDVVTIFDVPNIADVKALATLLNTLNVKVTKKNDHIIIDPTEIQNVTLDDESFFILRASYYFMGALLGRYKKVKIKIDRSSLKGL